MWALVLIGNVFVIEIAILLYPDSSNMFINNIFIFQSNSTVSTLSTFRRQSADKLVSSFV